MGIVRWQLPDGSLLHATSEAYRARTKRKNVSTAGGAAERRVIPIL
jgi:hypothetical protein